MNGKSGSDVAPGTLMAFDSCYLEVFVISQRGLMDIRASKLIKKKGKIFVLCYIYEFGSLRF